MNYHLTPKSANAKTGPIPVSTTGKQSCPDNCPLNNGNGCYAASGPLNLHWQAVTDGKRGTDVKGFADMIRALPDGQLWRHNQSGDLAHQDGYIDARHLDAIVNTNKGRNGFTYTHHAVEYGQGDMSAHNRAMIKNANAEGFTVNLSANNPAHADALVALDVGPVVTMVDEWHPGDARMQSTPAGNVIVICPAVTMDDMSCAKCGLCQVSNRKSIVGFPVHGVQKKKARTIMLKAA